MKKKFKSYHEKLLHPTSNYLSKPHPQLKTPTVFLSIVARRDSPIVIIYKWWVVYLLKKEKKIAPTLWIWRPRLTNISERIKESFMLFKSNMHYRTSVTRILWKVFLLILKWMLVIKIGYIICHVKNWPNL